MTSELKPCPFCGGEAHNHFIVSDNSLIFICCMNVNCPVKPDVKIHTPEKAIAAWNTRHGEKDQ